MGNCLKQKVNKKETELTEEDLNLLEDKTNLNRSTILEWHQNFLAENPNGKLTRKTFRLYNNESLSANREISKYIYRAYDKDRNGYVDFKEFLTGVTLLSSNKIEDKLRFVFDICDLDGDGIINKDEMIKLIRFLYEISESSMSNLSRTKKKSSKKLTKTIAKEIIKNFDKNGDKCLTQNEFIEGCSKCERVLELLVLNAC